MKYQDNFIKPERRFPELPQDIRKIEQIKQEGKVVRTTIQLCDSKEGYDLYYRTLFGWTGIIKTENADLIDKNIARITRVGKPTCFIIEDIDYTMKKIYCNRRIVQEEAQRQLSIYAREGEILEGEVTHLESYGAFVDIGCGITSLLPREDMLRSRISTPGHLMKKGDDLLVVYKGIDEQGRFLITHKELLGTWEENVQEFSAGEIVIGVVSQIEKYGCFIRLTPNLSGLIEYSGQVKVDDVVSVYIKSINTERKKIKLALVEILNSNELRIRPNELRYFIS